MCVSGQEIQFPLLMDMIKKRVEAHGTARALFAVNASPQALKWRWACANLIVAMSRQEAQSYDTIFVALEILDRWSASGTAERAPLGDGTVLQAAVMLGIASKTAETYNVFDRKRLQQQCDLRKLPKRLVRLELDVANKIGFSFPMPTLGYLFSMFAAAANLSEGAMQLAEYYAVTAAACSPMLRHASPAVLAAAAVALVQQSTALPGCEHRLAALGCSTDAVRAAAADLASVLAAATPRSSLIAQYYAVSSMLPVGSVSSP